MTRGRGLFEGTISALFMEGLRKTIKKLRLVVARQRFESGASEM